LQQQLTIANGEITRLTNDYQQEKQRADNLKTERDTLENQFQTAKAQTYNYEDNIRNEFNITNVND